MTENPGPGATYCPRCLKDSIPGELRMVNPENHKASEFHLCDHLRQCPHCLQSTSTRKWLNWNDIRDMEREGK